MLMLARSQQDKCSAMLLEGFAPFIVSESMKANCTLSAVKCNRGWMSSRLLDISSCSSAFLSDTVLAVRFLVAMSFEAFANNVIAISETYNCARGAAASEIT